jgi:CheY-like chemotaxis protein
VNEARILIVDDEAHTRETMQLTLEAIGYKTETAADGAEALEKFGEASGWDLVLLDQRMPGIEGVEVLRRMRERDPAARVIIVTAYGTIDLAVDAMKSGAVNFIRKPFTPEVLQGAVQEALAHPRQPINQEALTLSRLLPLIPQPLVTFRTLNGYMYWDSTLPAEEEADALCVRRGFDVQTPSGEIRRCVVEIAASLRELIRTETGHVYPPARELWKTVCRMALSDYLWSWAKLPPKILTVYELSHEQLEVVRGVVGLGLRVRR